MGHRQRYRETIQFGHPDKIPFSPGGPRESTLITWHQQGLAQDMDWQTVLYETLGIPVQRDLGISKTLFDLELFPTFEEKVLEHRNGHYIVQDWMGAIVEISDEYDMTYLRSARDFVTRKWHQFPVTTRADWQEKIAWRYDAQEKERVSPDLFDVVKTAQDTDEVVTMVIKGPFWQLREWCGMEGLCMLMVEKPDFVQDMIDFWRVFVVDMMNRMLPVVQPDSIMVSEDMAYKAHSMISPRMTRKFLLPVWKDWVELIRSYGDTILMVDSDGYIGELLPLFIEAGFESTWPVEVAAGNDIVKFREVYGHQIAFGGGVDKRAISAGGAVMLAELDRLRSVIEGGGYIPGCDHGVPPDISWPNFIRYSRRLAELTGWG